MTDSSNLIRIIQEVQPDEIYNLGAMSHVRVSFESPEYTAEVNGLGTLRLLEAIRILGLTQNTRFYQASTSELFGYSMVTPQNETTPFYPRSPYGVAKLYAHWICVNYREAFNMFISNGILFNHESPKRGETFVTRKITRAVTRIAENLQDILYLGNLNAERDWGHAKDYVRAMWLMLQHDKPDDFVIATGQMYSVRDLVTMAFEVLDLRITFSGQGLHEEGIIVASSNNQLEHLIGKTVVKIDPHYFRPTEVHQLRGDPSKAREVLNWHNKYSLFEMIEEMVHHDLILAKAEKQDQLESLSQL